MIEAALGAVTGLAALGVLVVRRLERDRLRAWVRVAEAGGVSDVAIRSVAGWPSYVEGRRGALTVRVAAPYHRREARGGPRIIVSGLPADLSLERESLDVPFAALLRSPDFETGDERFDQAVRVTGRPRRALAILDAPTRKRVLDAFAQVRTDADATRTLGRYVGLASGRLTVETPEPAARRNAHLLGAYLAEVLELAESLESPLDLEARVVCNVRSDPEPGVRLANLRELLSEGTRGPAAREALLAARGDGDERVQLEAAVALGAEGRATLLEIATREWTNDACAARAVAELRSALPAGRARDLLARALRTRRLETAIACLDSLSRRGAEHADVIGRVLGIEKRDVAAAAARALGRVGSARAIPVLRQASQRLASDASVTLAVREAIAAIQGRLAGAARGQLSLAGPGPGQLSLAADGEGRVSLPPDPDGSE